MWQKKRPYMKKWNGEILICKECGQLTNISREEEEKHEVKCSHYKPGEYLPVADLVIICGVSPPTIYEWFNNGLANKTEKLIGKKERQVCLLSEVENFHRKRRSRDV